MGLLLKSKLNAQNLINAISPRAVAVVTYSGGLIDSEKKKLDGMGRKIQNPISSDFICHRRMAGVALLKLKCVWLMNVGIYIFS